MKDLLASEGTTHVVRSMVQALWTAVLSMAAVAPVLESIGLPQEAAVAAAVTITMGVLILISRLAPIADQIISGIQKPPSYEDA